MTGRECYQLGTQLRQDAPTEHACPLITCVVQILQGLLTAEVMLSGNTRENISGADLWCSKRCNRFQDMSVQRAHTFHLH